jgi:hypothetical protein
LDSTHLNTETLLELGDLAPGGRASEAVTPSGTGTPVAVALWAYSNNSRLAPQLLSNNAVQAGSLEAGCNQTTLAAAIYVIQAAPD